MDFISTSLIAVTGLLIMISFYYLLFKQKNNSSEMPSQPTLLDQKNNSSEMAPQPTLLDKLLSNQLVFAIATVVLSFIANSMSDYIVLDFGEIVLRAIWDAIDDHPLIVVVLSVVVVMAVVGLLFYFFRFDDEPVLDTSDMVSSQKVERNKQHSFTEMQIEGLSSGHQLGTLICDHLLGPEVDPFQKVVWIRPYVQKLLHHLGKESIGVIGILGEEMEAKSTLLQATMDYIRRVDDNSHNQGLFHYVIYTVASAEAGMEGLQKDIAASLKLQIPNEANSDEVKKTIFDFLKDKDFLLLLDDLPRALDFKHLGIPNPYDKEDFVWCRRKVIFTTSSEEICSRMSAKTVKLKHLSTENAWKMFKENVQEDTISSPGIENLARQMAEEYSRVPVLLGLVGRAMSDEKDPQQWENALTLLRGSHSKALPSMEESIFLVFKLGYDRFQNEMLKKCFLACSLWPEDDCISKEDLIHCWMALGFIEVSEDDLNKAYDQGHSAVKTLQKLGILDPEFDEATVKMHDILRDFALLLTNYFGKNPWAVRSGVKGEAINITGEWKSAKLISLIDSGVKEVPEELLACENLSVLMLNENKVKTVSSGVLACLTSITYLDLSYTLLDEFPSNINHLVQLKYLNLSSTKIQSLPEELSKLDKLEYFFLRNNDIGKISNSLISSLPSLRVLDAFPNTTLESDSVEYFNQKLGAVGMACFKIRTLHKIHRLPTRWLRIWYLENLSSLQLKLLGSNMGKCLHELDVGVCDSLKEIVVTAEGDPTTFPPRRLHILKLSFLEKLRRIVFKGVEPVLALGNLEILTISNCPKLKNITWILRLPQLRQLQVSHCKGMERVISKEDSKFLKNKEVAERIFIKLRVLELQTLPRLMRICDYSMELPSLTLVTILDCQRLKHLPFILDMPKNNKFFEIHAQASWWQDLEESFKSSFQSHFFPMKDDLDYSDETIAAGQAHQKQQHEAVAEEESSEEEAEVKSSNSESVNHAAEEKQSLRRSIVSVFKRRTLP